MTARMSDPSGTLPGAFDTIKGLIKASHQGGVAPATLELVHLRASQINGCAACVDSGARAAKASGFSDERLWSVAVWRETTCFSEAERVALELSEAMTRLADRPDAVPDDLWQRLEKHYDEKALSALILWIATTNLFNRVNTTVRVPAGTTW